VQHLAALASDHGLPYTSILRNGCPVRLGGRRSWHGKRRAGNFVAGPSRLKHVFVNEGENTPFVTHRNA